VTRFGLRAPGRTEIGPGVSSMAAELAASAGPRALVTTGATPARADWLTAALRAHGVEALVVPCPGEPTVEEARAAVAQARDFRPAAVIGVGGGAPIDLAKAVAGLIGQPGDPLEHLEVVGAGKPLTADPPPLIAIPTTAGAGAEATVNAVLGAPEHGRKVSLRDPRLMPAVALVDPDLLIGLPRSVALASGLDAIVQVAEPFVSRFANPLTDALCRDAVPRGLAALHRLLEDRDDPQARADMALTAFCGGVALTNAKLGAVHGLAGVIGGRATLAHGAICGRLAPRVMATTEAAPDLPAVAAARFAMLRGWIAEALGGRAEDAWDRLERFVDDAGLPRLALGDQAEDIAAAAMASSSTKGAPVVPPLSALAAAVRES
jgi:alcohol dehydrogenase class IV